MLHDKETYIAMADACNRNGRKDKGYGISRAYTEVVGGEWPYGGVHDREYATVVREFLDTIHREGIYLRAPVMAPEKGTLDLRPYPCHAPCIHATGAESCKSILPLKDKKAFRYHVIGVLGEWVYATDGGMLVKIRDNRWGAFDGKAIPYSSIRDILEGKVPVTLEKVCLAYEQVLRQRRKTGAKCRCSVHPLIDRAYGAWRAGKSACAAIHSLQLAFNDKTSCLLHPERLFRVLNVLRTNGARQVDLRFAVGMLGLEADNGNTGIIMQSPPYNGAFSRVLIREIKVSECKK